MRKHSGGSRPSLLLQKITEVLEDGEWRTVSWVTVKAGIVVPPGVAIRAAEKVRLGSGNKGAPAQRAVPRSDEFLIAAGRRHLVREVLQTLRNHPDVLECDPPKSLAQTARIRLLRLPPKVEYWRRIDAEGRRFDAGEVLDQLLDSHDPEVVLAQHDGRFRLEKIIMEALRRLKA